jgi:hypothetical protein
LFVGVVPQLGIGCITVIVINRLINLLAMVSVAVIAIPGNDVSDPEYVPDNVPEVGLMVTPFGNPVAE